MDASRLRPIVIAGDRPVTAPSGLLLCDRDGVIVEDRPPHIGDISDVAMVPASAGALRAARRHGLAIVIVSNQSAVGRRRLTAEGAIAIHRFILDRLAEDGVEVDATYLCPHAPGEGCGCRKPAPGMVHGALTALRVGASRATLVGDTLGDMRAAMRAGVRPLLVRTGRGRSHEPELRCDPELVDVGVFDDLAAAVAALTRPGAVV